MKTKERNEKSKMTQGKGANSKSTDAKDMECFYCGKKGHKKPDCLRRKADLENAKVEGRAAVNHRTVHAVAYEDGHPCSSSIGDEARFSGGTPGISVIKTAPSEVAYVWVLSAAFMHTKHYPKGIMLDSGAAVSVSPLDYFPECGIRSGRHIELQAADGPPS